MHIKHKATHFGKRLDGDKDKAAQWMKRPVRGLGYVTLESMLYRDPIPAYTKTKTGTQGSGSNS